MFTEQQKRQIELQNKEFDALNELAKCFKSLQQTAVVDDDYPAVRHRYEGALREFVQALMVNARLGLHNEIETMRKLRELLGYVENGSEQKVTISQDDATKSFIVRWGNNSKNWQYGSSLSEAISNAHKENEA